MNINRERIYITKMKLTKRSTGVSWGTFSTRKARLPLPPASSSTQLNTSAKPTLSTCSLIYKIWYLKIIRSIRLLRLKVEVKRVVTYYKVKY